MKVPSASNPAGPVAAHLVRTAFAAAACLSLLILDACGAREKCLVLSTTFAACGSDSGSMMSVDSAAQALVTDGGECIVPRTGACTLDEPSCLGQTVCRSCNAALGLWKNIPAWVCTCGSTTVNGSTELNWLCQEIPGLPPCTLGPDTFVDSQCTQPAVVDAGSD